MSIIPERLDVDGINELLTWASFNSVSDLVIESDSKIWVKRLGKMETISEREIPEHEVRMLLQTLYQDSAPDNLVSGKYLKFAYEVMTKEEDNLRFRVTSTGVKGRRSDRGIEIIFRPFPKIAPSPAELGLPSKFVESFNSPYGIVLVSGPTGSGKSTSFASIFTDRIKNLPERVVTVEDPIEFDLKNIPERRANVVQSEVPLHLNSFEVATENLLRRSPDIVFFSEVRNAYVGREMLNISNTGHLVGTTIHANSAEMTLPRFIDMFAANEKSKITADIVEAMVGILSQRLVRAPNGTSRTAIMSHIVFEQAMRDDIYRVVSSNPGELKNMVFKLIEKHGLTLLSDLKNKFSAGKVEIEAYVNLIRQIGSSSDLKLIKQVLPKLIDLGFVDSSEYSKLSKLYE